jgi:hypothetical protein
MEAQFKHAWLTSTDTLSRMRDGAARLAEMAIVKAYKLNAAAASDVADAVEAAEAAAAEAADAPQHAPQQQQQQYNAGACSCC